MNFERIKLRYEQGYWSKDMVRAAVKKGAINKEQYEEITGEKFE